MEINWAVPIWIVAKTTVKMWACVMTPPNPTPLSLMALMIEMFGNHLAKSASEGAIRSL